MPVTTYGVAHGDISAAFFPNLAAFDGSSAPTSTEVGDMITESAAEINGYLNAKGVDFTSISSGTNAYAWCERMVKLGAAIKVQWAIGGIDSGEEGWRAEYERKLESLEKYGYAVLGDYASPTTEPSGPITHISRNSLTEDDANNMTLNVVPTFRKKDEL